MAIANGAAGTCMQAMPHCNGTTMSCFQQGSTTTLQTPCTTCCQEGAMPTQCDPACALAGSTTHYCCQQSDCPANMICPAAAGTMLRTCMPGSMTAGLCINGQFTCGGTPCNKFCCIGGACPSKFCAVANQPCCTDADCGANGPCNMAPANPGMGPPGMCQLAN